MIRQKEMFLVSIILPTYNRGYIIRRAIDSVFSQTYTNWELIIVDDGSTDDTFEKVNDYLNSNNMLKYIKQSNSGLALARNVGIKISNGFLITFLDSDDEYLENHLELRVNFLNLNRDIDLIYGGVKVIGDPYVPDKNNLSKKIHLDECVVGATFFGKKYVFEKLQGFKPISYSEDSEFLERAMKNFKVAKLDFQTYIYNREQTDSITNRVYRSA